jgi:uncharacterized membrane protein
MSLNDTAVSGLDEEFRVTKGTLIGFNDAVFAIAITLLALEIRMPHLSGASFFREFFPALMALAPETFGFAISFFVIAVFWLSYHRVMGLVQRLDAGLFWLNAAFLFFIAIMPFPSAVLGNYGGQEPAVIFYACIMAALSVILWALWAYAVKKGLTQSDLNASLVKAMSIRVTMPAIVGLWSIIIALFNPLLATLSWLAIPLLVRIARRRYIHR